MSASEANGQSSDVKMNKKEFWDRLELMRASWLTHVRNEMQFQNWNGSDCIVVCCGSSQDEVATTSKKNNIIHLWLFGFELLNTIIIITEKVVTVCAGEKICNIVKQNVGEKSPDSDLELQFIIKNKADKYVSNYENLIQIMANSNKGKKVGYIEQEQKGTFIQNYLERMIGQFEVVSFADALSDIQMVKDDRETSLITKASEFTSAALKYFQKRMESVIENEEKVSHSELSRQLTDILDDPKLVKSTLKKDYLDLCFDPMIQSGGEYRLKMGVPPSEEPLHYDYGTIVVLLGYRVRDYCATIARSFLIDASSDQKEIYNILVMVFKKGLLELRNNVELNKVYEACCKTIRKSNRPDLEQHFLKDCGWGIGLECKDRNFVINRKNRKQAKTGMVFNFQVGFQNMVDEKKAKQGRDKAAKFSLVLGDTVAITDDYPKFLTRFNRKLIDYQLNEDDDAKDSSPAMNGNSPKRSEKKKKKKNKENVASNNADDEYLPMGDNPNRRVTRQSNRKTAQQMAELDKARKERAKKQAMLRTKAHKHLQKLLADTGGDLGLQEEAKEWKDPNCYHSPAELPPQARSFHVSVDNAQECVLCPIMSHMVPFHISTIKNLSVSTTGEMTYLRLNFISPQARTNTNRDPKQPDAYIAHPESMFIKELTYRSSDGTNLQRVAHDVKELQKRVKQRAKQNKEQPLVDQERLKRNSGNRELVLRDLTIRPSLGGRKKGTGKLECHANGFRYVDHKRNEIHIMFGNIKHCFYQPAKNTPAVILHFHLRNPIMVGKKPSIDVQVSRDVIDRFEEIGSSTYDFDGGMRQEVEERRKIQKINKQFQDFVKRIETIAKQAGYSLEFDEPEMDLSFTGVPSKSNVTMYPTSSCLVALEDNPPFVLCTNDLELAHFERVQFSLRNFDLVFVFKDFLKEPMRISSIPREHIDTLQDFFNWQSVMYTQSKINLDWKEIMRSIRQDLPGFVEQGGWDFIRQDDDSSPRRKSKPKGKNGQSNADDDEYVADSASEYEPSGADDDVNETDDDYETDDGGDEEEYSDEEEHSAEEESDEDEGPSWEELDRRAEEQDRKSRLKERNREFVQTRSPMSGGRNNKRRRTGF